MNAKKFRILHNSLLRWYQRHARRLPWRDTKDPYKIWVSEIMLQQTQVATVIPYYKKWMRRFPTVNSLARASEDTVLKHWAGLGYYRRARMLHEGARMLCTPLLSSPRKSGGRNKVGGQLPSDVPSLMKIPGIGRYTAGAIASIAFNRPEPILDGNVKRILSRIFAVKDPADTRDGEKKLWEIAKQLVTSLRAPKGGVAIPAKRLLSATRRGGPAVLFGGRFARNDRKKGPGTFGSPGDFNQAMMELGATVCLPRTPRCGECPVVRSCNAYARNRQSEYPLFFRKEQTEKKKTAALIIRKKRQCACPEAAGECPLGRALDVSALGE